MGTAPTAEAGLAGLARCGPAGGAVLPRGPHPPPAAPGPRSVRAGLRAPLARPGVDPPLVGCSPLAGCQAVRGSEKPEVLLTLSCFHEKGHTGSLTGKVQGTPGSSRCWCQEARGAGERSMLLQAAVLP